MKWSTAFIYLKRGHKIKLPEWGGYWYWDKENKTIKIVTRKGEELDIRSTEDVDYTFSFIGREDWELVNEGCQCEECVKLFNETGKRHWSDCAVHNEPAMPKGECNCNRGN